MKRIFIMWQEAFTASREESQLELAGKFHKVFHKSSAILFVVQLFQVLDGNGSGI